MSTIALLVFLCILILPFLLYRFYRIRQVKKYGQDLYLTGKIVSKTSKGRYGMEVSKDFVSFYDYRFVTDKNPYGTVFSLNEPKKPLTFESGNYHVRYLKKGEKIFLVILEE